jgi:hypothetical protein
VASEDRAGGFDYLTTLFLIELDAVEAKESFVPSSDSPDGP